MSKNKTLVVVLVILAVHVMMTLAWHGRSYRPDESWTVLAGLFHSPQGVVEYIALHDVAALPAPWLTIQGITHFAGHHEVAVRYAQFLFVVLGLSFLYQLGRLLYSHRVGVIAVLLAGMTPIFIAHASEARSYSILFFATAGLMLFFQRWLVYGRITDVLAYVLIGIYGVYSHQFVVFVIMMQFAYFVLFVRYDVGLFVRGVVMVGYVALALILGWGLIFAHVYLTVPGGIGYSPEYTGLLDYFVYVFSNQLSSPLVTNLAIIGLGIAIPSNRQIAKHRFPRVNGGLYLAVIAFGVFLFAWYLNQNVIQILTDRNLLTVVPAVALLAANFVSYAMDYLYDKVPRFFVVALILILPFFVTRWHTVNWPMIDFNIRTVGAMIEQENLERTGFIILTDRPWLGTHMLYQLVYRLDVNLEQIIFITDGDVDSLPIDLDRAYHTSELTAADVDEFLGQYDRVVKMLWGWSSLTEPLTDQIESRYYLAKADEGSIEALELYRLQPDDMTVDVQFGMFELIEWQVVGGVEVAPCETVQVESLWRVSDTPDAEYSLSLTLIDADGQFVAQSDSLLGGREMATWDAGRLRNDLRGLQIPCDTPTGSYPMTFGVYDPLTMQSLSTVDTNQNFYYLTNIVIK